jgi:hypothetical protein
MKHSKKQRGLGTEQGREEKRGFLTNKEEKERKSPDFIFLQMQANRI